MKTKMAKHSASDLSILTKRSCENARARDARVLTATELEQTAGGGLNPIDTVREILGKFLPL